MKFKHLITICILIGLIFFSCNLNPSVGARFELLKETPVWQLAQAVEVEDTAEIRELIHLAQECLNVSKWRWTI